MKRSGKEYDMSYVIRTIAASMLAMSLLGEPTTGTLYGHCGWAKGGPDK